MKNKFPLSRIILCIFLMLTFAFESTAQVPALTWAKSMGGTDIDAPAAIVTDATGNTYTTGVFRGSADFDPGPGVFTMSAGANPDIFVLKLDAAGSFVWAKKMGALNDDRGLGIALDGTGNVYITGNFQGTVDFDPGAAVFNLTATGNLDAFVSKLDPSGNFVWAKGFGGTNTDIGRAITVHGAGVYVTGLFAGTVDFDPGAATFNVTSIGPGSQDIFILKLDDSGNFQWVKTVGGMDNDDEGNAITTDATGNVYTTGAFQLTADLDPGASVSTFTSAGERDAFVLKLDPSGNFVWAKSMGGADDDVARSVKIDTDGNVYTTGFYYLTADFDPGAPVFNLTAADDQDVFISKLDASGNFLWAKSLGGEQGDEAFALLTDEDNNVYVSGFYSDVADFNPGTGTYELTANGGYDAFMCKLDATGNFQWAFGVGGTSLEIGYGMGIDASGALYLTGMYSQTVDFDPGAGTYNLTYNGNAGNPDIFLMKLGQAGASALTITSFSPANGPINTEVTIIGTNFSTTPASNTVKFNGTTAAVSASTTTSITTRVPAGATTGKITVTVGGSTATSATDFTVTAQGVNQPPVIASTTTALSAGGIVVVDLVSLITDVDNNLDLSTLAVVTPVTQAGAEAELNAAHQLLLNYDGVFFLGIDRVTIAVCDLAASCTQQQITIEVTGDLIIYNGISPNNDAFNGTWQIKNIDVLPDTRKNKVTIYNRWGDEVFAATDYDNDKNVFTGNNNDHNELPSGTYFYKIEFTSGRASKSGFIVLKR